MAEPKKRTSDSVFDALQKISEEEDIDFGLGDYTADSFRQKYFTGPGNIENLYNKLNKISKEENIDFGQGTPDEWLASFGYMRNPDTTSAEKYVRTDGSSVVAPSSPSNAVTTSVEKPAVGSDAWRQQLIEIPGDNPYNGRSYGEAYDEIIQSFGKNISHPDVDPYAEARAQIMQSGITDDLNPDEAETLALNIREGYANQYAGINARAMVKQLPDQVPNIDQLLDGMWYNRELQGKLSHEAQRLGLSHENYVNFYMKPQLAKALKERYGYDVESAKQIVGRLLSGEQHTMERVRQGEANDMIESYAEPKLQEYFDRSLKDAERKFNAQMKINDRIGMDAGAMLGTALNYYSNTDPVKVWEEIKPNIETLAKDIVDVDFIIEADKHAEEEGVDVNTWLEGRIIPVLESQIQATFERMALEREMPKSTKEYLIANTRKSLVGTLLNAALASKARRRMQDEALARTEMGQGIYKPGYGAVVAGGVSAMLPDMLYGGPFGLASKVATKPVQGMAQALIADGIRPLVARMAQSAASGSLSLGAFEAIKGGVEGKGNARFDSYLDDDQRSAGEILSDIVSGAFEHGVQSGVMGATMVGGPLGQKLSNGRGVLSNILGWGTQVGVDAAGATALTAATSIPEIVSGDVTLEDLGRDFAHNVGTFAALGLNHKAKEFASLTKGGRSWNGVEFTKKDIETLEGRFLQPLRTQITEIERAQNRRGLVGNSTLGIDAKEEQREAVNSLGAMMYNDLMHSYTIPRELKVKVAQALGMPIPEYALKPEVLQLEKDVTAKSIDLGWIDFMNNEYNKDGGVAEKLRNGEPLNDSELTLRLIIQDNEAYNEALKKQQAGEELSDQELELIETNDSRLRRMFMEYDYRERRRLASEFEKEHELEPGTIARMMRDAAEGKAVESELLSEYEQKLREYDEQLDAAEQERETSPDGEGTVAEPDEEATGVVAGEEPKINRVTEEIPATTEDGKPDLTNNQTGTVIEVQLIDGRKAYVKDGDINDEAGLISLVDESGWPIVITDQNGYTHDQFAPSIIARDEKGKPIVNESKADGTVETSPDGEGTAAAGGPLVESDAISKIPVNEKGERQWEKSTVEDTVAALRETLGSDKEVAEMVDEEIADVQSLLKELTTPAKGKDKKHSNMDERIKKRQAIKDAQAKLDHWNQVKEAMKPVEQPVTEQAGGEEAGQEPEKPLVPEQPAAAGGTSPDGEGTAAAGGKPPRRPEQTAGGQPPKNPVQPTGPTAEQKIAQGTIKNNIGKHFGFTNQDGSHSEVTIELFKGDDKVVVTRQDYDRNEHPIGEPYRQDLNLVAVSNSIINGYMKPALTVKEKLGNQFKVTVGNVKLIDVLTDAEQQQLLDLYKKGDKQAIGNLTGDLIDAHHEDLILKGREERNDKVNRIMEGNGSREDKLRRVRKEYQGWEDSVISLSDEALQPTTLEEYVADLHSRQPRSGEGPLAYFSYKKDGKEIVGMQDETGHGTKSGGDTKGYAPWLAPKGKGMSLAQYAETIHSQLPEAIQQQYSDQDVRNAILDVFGSAERPSDITTKIIRRGIVEAENAARRQEEMWIDGGPAFHKVTAEDHSFAGLLERAKQQTNADPTEGQKRVGNYKKGRISFGGYDFVIENAEGTTRRGKDDSGKEWEQKMHNTYGYILGKRGKDGDHLDMFINDDADLFNWNGNVYVVDQRREKLDEHGKPTGEWEFDEHKIMYGFDSESAARDAYLSNYEDGWQGLGKITGVDKETFDKWLDSSDKKVKEFAEHSIVKEKSNKHDGEKHIVTDGEIEKAFVNELGKALDAAGVPRSYDVEEGQPLLDRFNQQNMAEEGVMPDVNLDYHKVDDKDTLEKLNSGKTVKRYRAMQLIDGKLYPPMSAKVDGEMRQPTEIGVWEQSDERPDLLIPVIDKKTGKQKTYADGTPVYKFKLDKGQKGQGNVPAAYNPYFHTSTSGLNDQFTTAYKRPELVVVEAEIPESELSSGYKAYGAKDAVGDTDWHSGVVNAALPEDRQRTVTLSRYSKVIRIVPDNEVADMIAKQLEGTNVEVPYNVVTPQLRKELENRGVKISAKPAGTVTEDINGNPIRQQKVDKPIFYSNAMRAVEGIKQEKATPEQWIAMLTKAGGLKVGEDKWLNLSDWLNERKGKSVTKQEIMDYIRDHQIQVEEVPYSEYPDVEGNPKMQEFRDEFNKLVNKYETERLSVEDESNAFNDEMFKKYGQGWASDTDRLTEEERAKNDELIDRWHELNDKGVQDLAIQEMVDKYGDNFGMAFDVKYGNGRLEPVLDMFGEGGLSDAARYFLEIDEHPIHSIRLNYTTEGLENKKEIALTVPTIEPYNEGDEVHFGDAGEGRAVAWVRFGETYAPNMGGDPNSLADGVARTLVIDEIQSKRHQDAREKGYKGDISEADKKRISELRSGIKELDAKCNALIERSFKLRETIQKEQAKDLVDDEGVVIDGKWDEYFALFDNNKELNQLEQEKDGLVVQISDLKEQLRELERPSSSRVPAAPFEKNWHELAMKRMLRYAAENGYDKIAWTTGDQQAERYNLSDKVDEIKVAGGPDNIFTVIGIKDGGILVQKDVEGEKGLAELIGKDLARKAYSNLKEGKEDYLNADGAVSFTGDNLVIGGEGMKGFYDDMLVRFMNKYGKKWGVKVEQTELPEIGQTMWTVDVTPEMKESVMQGQPMFFKTPDGHAYGFTYKGKIYVDPRIATAETPIHEYGHLWSEMKRMTSPEEWNAIKDVLMHDKVIEPFIEKVKNDYPELTEEGMEDDFVEEVLTQYSGRRGAERLRQAAQEIKKELGDDAMAETIAEAAVRKVKGILNDFWKGVCDMMGWQYTSADDIADAILRDLLNGVNPNEKINEAKNNRAEDLKQRQLDIILKENPADDENMPGHTWIRSLEDINTFKEALEYDGYGANEDITPDFTADMVKDVLEKGTVIVYSSKPIKNGAFVTPSKMEAQNYAGDGKIYSKEVSLTDVAWIDATQGQYAKVPEMPKTQLVGEIGASTADMREHTTSRRDSQVVIMGDGTSMNINDIKPIGTNRFGGVYDQFKGKVKEAFDFLTKKKDGYLMGVFHRKDLGDIDLAWGSAPTDYTGKGLAHIIRKHINVLKDFSDINDAMRIIEDVVNNGKVKQNSDPRLVNIEKGDYRVVIAKNNEGNWILSAFDFVKPKKEKGKTLPPSKTPGQSDVEAGAVTSNLSLSDGKDTKNNSNFQEKSQKNAAERAAETEIGGALVDRLQDMGIDVGTDFNENRKVRKAAEKDNSEAGKIRNFTTPGGKVYGFTYKGKMYLDPRKIDGELPIHEYGHLWCGAFRKLNPEGWKSVVETMKTDGESWDVIKRLNPDLTDEHDIAEEMISKYSGERGAERLRAELERLSKRDSQYASRWGNIYKNISKAIQDFWKQMGDFLHIQYDSPEQVYDQVMKDFADKVNPQSMVERYLESRNADYMKAAEAGDKAKAAEIFNEALRENIGNGITPYIAAGTFFANKELARAVKTRDAKAVRSVAEKIAPLIPKDAVLVPAPGHDGKATDMLDVANAVAEITGAEVADVLKSESRTSQYKAKKAGKALTSAEMGITVTGEPLPAGKVPVVIDNVVDTGNTAEACVKALGKGIVVTLGDSADRYDHAASLKSAEPIVTDKNGNIVPLSKRFEIGGSKRLDKAPRLQKVGGDIHSDNFQEKSQKSSIQGLEDYSEDEINNYVRDFVKGQIESTDADAEIVDVKIIGSRTNGTAKPDSDLDVLVEFKGKEREDDMFNMLAEADEPLVINGIKIDINPIRADKSGTIAEFLERNKDYRKEDSELLRDGEAKTVVLNEEQRKLTPKQLRARHKFAERQWRRAHEWADDTVKKLNLGDNVTIVDNIDELEGYEKFPARKKNAKGWYDPKTGKIVIVMDNHRSPTDVVKTILHEGVAHHGLRKLFGSNFDTFLDNAYKSATFEIRESIDELAKQHNGDVREATEEYMGRLAEDTDFEDAENRPWLHHWFNQIKQSFLNMLKSLGLKNYRGVAGDITDNELRYILWRSYKNLSSPGSYRNVFHSEDIAMQVKMNVGNYQHDREPMQPADTSQSVAEADVVEMPSSKYKRIDDFKKDHPDTIAMSYSSDGDVFIVRGDDATAISNTYRVGDLQEVDGVPTLFIPAQGRILDMLLPKLVRNGQKMALLDYDMESMEPSFSSFGPKSESYIDNYHEMRMAVKRNEIARLKSQIPQEEPLYNAWQNASTDAEREKARERYETYYKEHQDTIEQLESAAVELDEMEDGLLFRDGDETPRFQRVSNSDMPIEDRQSRKQWENAMKKWKERNALPIDAQEPTEKPVKRPDEDIMEYVLRLSQYNRDRAMWNTAPKLEDYMQVRDDKDVIQSAREYLDRYPDSPSAKMRLIAAEALRLRHAMSRQKAYDKATVKAVTDFAQEYMTMGFGDNLRRNEVARLLSSIKNATGAKDIRSQIDNIMNTLTDNYLRGLDQQVVKLSSVKELRLTAQGVEHQGKLELKGQRMIQAFREARQEKMTADDIRNRLSDVLEYMSRDDEEAPMWEQEYEGLSIALQYAENIDGSRSEYKALYDEYRDAVKSYRSSGRSYKEQQEYLECLERSMMENKLERIGMFGEIINRLQGNIAESMEGAKEFVEREKERVRHIQQLANFDLADMDSGSMRVQAKGKSANFFLQPLATFEQMLKQFGSRNAKGEGYLYNYFMRNWARSTDRAFTKEQAAKEELDEKAREVFGDQIKRWSDLYMLIRNEKDFPGMDVAIRDQNAPKVFHLNQGNLLYIYMANKMNDGAMKLRKMGITEEDVAAIEEHLDSRLVALGDWLQDDYLVRKRIEYNKVHERMFGAPMATIEHYYPIRVLADARYQEQDVNVPEVESLPSTITGNIIKRRRNTLPLDILHTDALSVAVEHIEDMERWAATAEFNRDINTLLSYTTFRNKVKNMKTIYGSGDALWNTFADTARMAAGTYRPKAKTGGVDKTITNIAKGVTAAKINFRMYTAFKQILSAPAFLHDVRIDDFVKNAVNPYGSWKWAMENMPMFQKRWKSRQAGDTRLMDDPTDWKMWKTNIVQMATRMGMSPNALVDGVTCAVGARSIYESRLRKYKEMGLSDEEAESRALDDAEIGYNLTQQSSEGAFVSAIQKDRTVVANMLSVFRNSSMAYTRQWVDAARNLKHRMQPGYKDDSIRFMKHQFMVEFGMDEAKALAFAEAEYARAGRHEVARMLNMMFGVTIAWNLGASLPYLLMGDDDETKKEMMTDALIRGLIAGPTEGFAAGNIISELVSRSVASSETRKTLKEEGVGAAAASAVEQASNYKINPLPLFSDIQGTIDKMGYDGWNAAQDVFNIAMQSAVGVNPQTFTDMWNACMDYACPGWDGTKYKWQPENMIKAKEIALFIMRLMNAPTSSWRNKYIDELGLDADEAQKLSYDEMAKRYAHYKQWKDTPFMGWLRGEAGRAEKVDKIRKQFDKAVQDRMDRLSDEALSKAYDQTDDRSLMDMIVKSIGKRVGGKDLIGTSTSKKEDVQAAVEYYVKNRTGADLVEDLQLEAFRRNIQAAVDDGSVTQKQLDVVQELGNVIKAIKAERDKMTPNADNKEHWKVIREKREAILKKIAEAK